MGGLCSKGSAVDKSPSDTTLGPGRVVDHHDRLVVKEEKKAVVGEAAAKKMEEEQHQRQRQQHQHQLHWAHQQLQNWSTCYTASRLV